MHMVVFLSHLMYSPMRIIHVWFPTNTSHLTSLSFCVHSLSHVWLCDPTDCSPPASSVYGISQARILEWVTVSSPWSSSPPKDQPVSPAFLHWWGLLLTTELLVRLLPLISKRRMLEILISKCCKKLRKDRYLLNSYWCFRTVVLENTLESPYNCKEIKPVHPKGDQSWIFIGRTDAEAETPILWPPDAKNWLREKDPDAGKDWRQEEKGMTEDEIVGWHHWHDGHEFEQALGAGEGQGILVCCSPCGHKDSDMTELTKLTWGNDFIYYKIKEKKGKQLLWI